METSLPSDSLALQKGITLGKPLDAESELGKAVDILAGKLMGVVPAPVSPQGRFAIRPLFSHT